MELDRLNKYNDSHADKNNLSSSLSETTQQFFPVHRQLRLRTVFRSVQHEFRKYDFHFRESRHKGDDSIVGLRRLYGSFVRRNSSNCNEKLENYLQCTEVAGMFEYN